MSLIPEITFSRSTRQQAGLAVVLCDQNGTWSSAVDAVDPEGVLAKAARISDFKGKEKTELDVVAPSGSAASRILVLGAGKPEDWNEQFWIRLGGRLAAAIKSMRRVTVWLDMGDGRCRP